MSQVRAEETPSATSEGLAAFQRTHIVALRLPAAGTEFDLPAKQRQFAVGTRSDCDVVLRDKYVSSVHCILERNGANLTIRDRGSKNGTFLNGNRVEVAELSCGAHLTVGKTRLIAVGEGIREQLTPYERLRGRDPVFRGAVDRAIAAASSDCSVLIVGETGTGKELIASAIHAASRRMAGPFVALNCGALPGELVGSELFGHVRGAFTGAVSEHRGVFTRASGGTLFLDELGELPLGHQPHLLRVLETGVVRPVGAQTEHAVDTRLVAATNRLEGLGTSRSRLRLDLYHRISTVVVELPPLRERPGDIKILAEAFVDDLSRELGPRYISRATMHALVQHDWPGNVRELRQAVHRAFILCERELTREALLQRPGQQAASPPTAPAAPRATPRARRNAQPASIHSNGAAQPKQTYEVVAVELPRIDAIMRDAMLDALDRMGSIRRAAQYLGMPKSTFSDRARRFGIRLKDNA